tara:strand:- start:4971 stop:5456 length:486 start_codon:yes stop_codon:yes gene_type:complete
MKVVKYVGVALILFPSTICNTFTLIKNTKTLIEKPSPIKPPDKLIQALIQIESSNNDSCIGDKHMKIPSIGCLQIRPIMICEANRILKIQQNPKRFNNKDRWSRIKSIEIFNVWKSYHHKNSTNEVIARCWNGGPKGFKKSATLGYWKKVKKHLKFELGKS